MEIKRVEVALEIKALEADGTFEGWASKYDVIDRQGDVVKKGSFSKTLQESKQVPILWQHNSDEVIGMGTLVDTEAGLIIKGQLDMDDPVAIKAHSKLKKGLMRGLSIGFTTVKDAVSKGVREILEAKLWEVSIVTFPANQDALVTGVKSSSLPAKQEADTNSSEPGIHSVFASQIPRW